MPERLSMIPSTLKCALRHRHVHRLSSSSFYNFGLSQRRPRPLAGDRRLVSWQLCMEPPALTSSTLEHRHRTAAYAADVRLLIVRAIICQGQHAGTDRSSHLAASESQVPAARWQGSMYRTAVSVLRRFRCLNRSSLPAAPSPTMRAAIGRRRSR